MSPKVRVGIGVLHPPPASAGHQGELAPISLPISPHRRPPRGSDTLPSVFSLWNTPRPPFAHPRSRRQRRALRYVKDVPVKDMLATG